MIKYRWFPLDAVDWRSSFFIRSLSRAQTGAYVTLLVELWLEKNCSLPTDRMALKKLAHWDQKLSQLEPVIAHLIPHPQDPSRLTDERLYQEWQKSHRISLIRQQAALSKSRTTAHLKPLITSKDRTTKGFQPITTEVKQVADKWFPPV